MPQYPPYRPQVQPPAGMDLPFDPNAQGVYSPEEMQSQQPLRQADQSLQQALGNQQQSQQAPGGLQGLLSNPIFQLAVPTALTTLSAIFPRHMAGAGAIGMAGFRTVEDQNQMGIQRSQTKASDDAKARLDDFQRQRLKYVLHHSDIDPSQLQAIDQESNVDVKGAANAFTSAAKTQAEVDRFDQNTTHFNPSQLSPGESRTFSGGGQSQTFTAPQPSLYSDEASGDPDKIARAKKALELQHSFDTPSDFDVYAKGYRQNHPQADDQEVATTWRNLAKVDATAEKNKTIDRYLTAVEAGTAPIPLPSARGGMTPEFQDLIGRANERGINLRKLQEQQLANIELIKNMNKGQWQSELKNVTATELMMDNLQKAYQEWDKYSTGIETVNDVMLQSMSKLDTPMGHAATQLRSTLAETRRALGTLLQSGASITDEAARATHDIMTDGMPKGNFAAALATSRSQVGMRKWALLNPEALTPDGPVHPDRPETPPLMETGEAATHFPEQKGGGQYKTRKELSQAVSSGKLSIPAAKAYAKAHPDMK